MTLDGMNAYLEEQGFDVHRERDSKRNVYVFTIAKPGYESLTRDFKYPGGNDWHYKNRLMTEFMDGMVRDFYKGEKKDMKELNGWDYMRFFAGNERTGLLEVGKLSVPVKVTNVTMTDGDVDLECSIMPTVYTDRVYRYTMAKSLPHLPEIKNVIFNDPATIVFWADGTKTVVKCQEGREFDPEKGLSMAFCEKAFGDKTTSHKVFNKWLPKEEIKEESMDYPNIQFDGGNLAKAVENAKNSFANFCDRYHGLLAE